VKRREFITLLGSAAAWPVAARAQQERMRRIGVLVNLPADDPQAQTRNAALLQGLQELGWTVGRNVRIDFYLKNEVVKGKSASAKAFREALAGNLMFSDLNGKMSTPEQVARRCFNVLIRF
jgi:hypothetical protein